LRVLLDENVDRRLKRVFDEQHEVSTVPERGWAGMTNGELLEEAGKEFDALVTTDRGILHQQDLSRFDLAVVVLETKSNSYEDLAPLMHRTNAALAEVVSGEATRIRA
jgi:predicted nuclease of predicted toxin-antitoxin system